MHRKLLFTSVILLMSLTALCFGQKQIVYKQVDTTSLVMRIYSPEKQDPEKQYPAIVFFFGGGWNSGSIGQFEPHAKHFAERGMVCFLVDYRVKSRQKTSPFESLKDAKSAMRYVRKNAKQFNVDPDRIAASGGSAGGHLAAATAITNEYNESTDDLTISSVPNALVLFNPVIDNGPAGYGYERVGEAYKNFSSLHNIKKGMPPTIIMVGTKDKLIPVETVSYYKKAMEIVGSRCDLSLYEGEEHGFFNVKNKENHQKTLMEADKFLQSLGYIK